MVGKYKAIFGKYVARIKTNNIIESGNINFLETSIIDLSAIELATNKVIPYGGVIIPIDKFNIMIKPKCRGSTPNAIATGISTGTSIRIAEILSINIPISNSNKLTFTKNQILLSEKPSIKSEIF